MTLDRPLDRSRALLARAYDVIPSATQTFSKGPTQWASGVSPSFLDRGDGAWVWDVDGNRYLDHLMALGPVILGYRDQEVDEAIRQQLDKGIVFSQMHELEVTVAEKLVELIPCAEMVRFGKNGTDVTSAAVRAARAFTGNEVVACCGYHGWQDWYIGTTTRSLGVPKAVTELTVPFTYNDLGSLERVLEAHPGGVAAVIMEAVGVEQPAPGFLEGVRELTRREGVVLIFDEIITGFRLGIGGAHDRFGVTPDLACFGKAMANGMPLSAVVGSRQVMSIFDEVFFSGTFGGETLSLAAADATMRQLVRDDVMTHIASYGSRLLVGFQALIDEHGLTEDLLLLGFPERSVLSFPNADEREVRVRRSFFMQECVRRGLLYFGSHLPTAAHGDEELSFTLGTLAEVVPAFAAARASGPIEDRLEGPCVEAIFRRP